MFDTRAVDDLSRRVDEFLPPALRNLRRELHRGMRSALRSGLEWLDLVTREEFALQARTLEHTRSRLRELERQMEELEKRIGRRSA